MLLNKLRVMRLLILIVRKKMTTRTFSNVKLPKNTTPIPIINEQPQESEHELKVTTTPPKSKSKSSSKHSSAYSNSTSQLSNNEEEDNETMTFLAKECNTSLADSFITARGIINDLAKKIDSPELAQIYKNNATERLAQAIDTGIEMDRVFEIPMNEFMRATGSSPYTQQAPYNRSSNTQQPLTYKSILNILGSLASIYMVYYVHFATHCVCDY